jgi:hypothetical protein
MAADGWAKLTDSGCEDRGRAQDTPPLMVPGEATQGGAGRPPSSFGFDGPRYNGREIDCQRPRPPSRRCPSSCFSLLSGAWTLDARVRDAPVGRVSMPILHLEQGFPVSISEFIDGYFYFLWFFSWTLQFCFHVNIWLQTTWTAVLD